MRISGGLATILLLLISCTNSNTQPLHVEGYDWQGMKKNHLQGILAEISGIAYNKKGDDFLAVNDEQGTLYVLDKEGYKIKQSLAFGKPGDYECVSIVGDKVFVLKSNGDIHTMRYNGSQVDNITTAKYSGPKAEFEATVWNEKEGLLYVITKKSGKDNKAKITQVYAYDPVQSKYLDTAFSIPWSEIESRWPDMKGFHPSAAAIQPATGDIFIVSSIEKLLVILGANWHVKSVHQLDSKLFQQPEGLTFDSKNNLYITNEAAGASPTLIFIPYK